jgi:hypothetical protein
MDMKASWAWKVIVGGLAVEILIAAVATWTKATGSCGSCGSTSPAAAAVGAAGVVLYVSLCAIALWTGPTILLFVGIFAGFAVHAALMILMISGGPVCPPCVLAFVVSAILLVSSIIYEPVNLRRAALVLPVAVFFLQAGSFAYGLIRSKGLAQAHSDVTPNDARRDGRVRIVVFEDSHCPYCRILERDVLPEIEREFGERLEVIRRSSAEIPGMALPTVIVVGEREEVFDGLPSRNQLRTAILRALTDLETGHVSTSVLTNP